MAMTPREKIQDLERQLDELTRQQSDMRRRIEAQNTERLRQMEAQMNEAIAANKRRMDAAYALKIQEMRQDLVAEMQRQVEEIRRLDQGAQARRQALVAQLRATTEELQAELKRIKDDTSRREAASWEMAQQLNAQAEDKAKDIEQLAHEFFCPSHLNILKEHLKSVQSMLGQYLNDAAAATADSALAELQLLEIDIREKQREWEEIYSVFRNLSERLVSILNGFENEELTTPAGNFHLNHAQREYWSGNAFGQISSDIHNAHALVENIDAAGGVTQYLKTGSALKGFQFSRQISKLYALGDRLSAVISCIRNERIYSDERFVLAESAENALEERGYAVVDARFRGTPENLLDCFDLDITINGGRDVERVSFVPIRNQGIVTGTACIVTISPYTYPNAESLRDQAQSIIALIHGFAPTVQTSWFSQDDMNAQVFLEQMNQPPNVEQYTRTLARKYRT